MASCVWRVLGQVLGALCALSSAEASAFLGSELPLQALAVLPSNPDASRATRLSGRTALTVVFSRPVIALGADWSENGNNGTLPQELTPFSLQACSGQPAFAVPGKLRWATTSIARFDADIDWPTDLCFDLVLNAALRSHDGLALPTSQTWRYETREVTMSIQSVRSEIASNLTGGRWSSPTLGEDGVDEEAHECPSDCIAYLRFSYDLDHALTFSALRSANPALLQATGSETYENCGRRCIAVRPRGLTPGRHSLIFPSGGSYSRVAGVAATEQSVKLSGVLPFRFAFWFETPPAESWRNKKLSYRRYKFYLRHGLPEFYLGSLLTQLKSSISLTDRAGSALSFSLSRPDLATLQLDCPSLQPDSRYTLRVSANDGFLDGMRQPLQQSSMEFDTAGWPSAFVSAQDSPARFRTFSGDWKILSRGPENHRSGTPYKASAWPVPAADFVSALALRYNSDAASPAGKTTVSASLQNELEVLGISNETLLPNAGVGLFMQEITKYGTSRNFVSVAHFGVSFVATEAGELLVWASSFETGDPVSGASVMVYKLPTYRAYASSISLVASGTTGPDGTATLQPQSGGTWLGTSHSYKLVAIVTSGSDIALAEDVPTPTTPSLPPLRATLVTDRRIYKPGDSVYVKSYLRSLTADGTNYLIPGGTEGFVLEAKWKRDANTESGVQRLAAEITSFGTLSGELTVPVDEDAVSYGDVQITLQRPNGATWETVASASLTVADPRPPTVELEVTSPSAVVLPGAAAALELGLKAKTFSGTGVEGAEVTLTWTLTRSSKTTSSTVIPCYTGMEGVLAPTASVTEPPGGSVADGSAPRVSGFAPDMPTTSSTVSNSASTETGQLTVVTGAGGVTTVNLDVAALLNVVGEDGTMTEPCAEGDTFAVSARWVGPTREVVTAELEGGALRVARSAHVLKITPAQAVDATSGKPLPGQPFSVYVDLQDGSGASLSGTRVDLSLHEWDGQETIWEDPVVSLPATSSLEDMRNAARQSGLRPVTSWGTQVGSLCAATADAGTVAQCGSTLTLPAVNKYVVLARAQDPDGVELVVAFAVGKTPAEWAKKPLASLDSSLVVQSDKASYAVGENVTLRMVSPFQDARALVVWGNGVSKNSKQQLLAGSPGQEHTITLEVSAACSLGCNALVLLIARSQPRAAMLPVEVPVSPLLDVSAPRYASSTVRLEVPDIGRSLPGLSVSVPAPAGALLPGSAAEVQVQAEAGAEVCVFVVDKAMLSVGGPARPHSMKELDGHFKLQRGEAYRVVDTRQSLASFDGYSATSDTAVRRAAIDPWVTDSSWRLTPSLYGQAPVELSDEDYFAGKTSDATKFPPQVYYYSPYPPYQEAAADGAALASMPGGGAAERDAIGDSGAADDGAQSGAPTNEGGSSSTERSVYVRSEFVTTPLFAAAVVVDGSGSTTVSFTLPDNVATFEVRVYAVDGRGAHQFGQATTSFISRRNVSMVPSVPRVARPGDLFECGVSLTGHLTDGLPPMGVSVSAQVAPGSTGLALGNLAQRSLAGDAGSGPHELTFPFTVPSASAGGGIGSATLTFNARLQDSTVIDAMEVQLPVKAPQGVVTLATSMALIASENTEPWSEGIDLPNAMPGSGQVGLTAGVGYLPSVVRNAAHLMGLLRNYGQLLVSALVPTIALGLYYPPGVAVGNDALAAAALDAVAAMYAQARSTLPSYTSNNGYYPLGLMWRAGDYSNSWYTPRASVDLNAYGVLVSRLSDVLVSPRALSTSGNSNNWVSLTRGIPSTLTSTWRLALERELQRQVQELRSRSSCSTNCYRSWETLAMVRAAMGFAWSPTDSVTRQELSMSRLFSKEALDSLRAGGLAKAGLAYTLHANPEGISAAQLANLEQIYTRLVSLMRVQGQTAYVAAAPGSPHSAGLEGNAYALLLIARAGSEARARHFAGDSGSTLAAKLAAYVADGAGAGRSMRFGGGYWMGDRAAAMASAALAAYDEAHGSTSPDLVLTATSGTRELLNYEARGPAPPAGKASVPWEDLSTPPEPLRFTATGTGQVSLVASLTFVPATIPRLGSIYRGIFVEKAVHLMDPSTGKPKGRPVQIIPLGESVVVTIQVTTPDDLTRVTLEDLSAGGLEPVDPLVAGDDAGSSSSNGCSGMGWWSWWCVPSFYYRQTYADRVSWTSWATLQAGTHMVSYQAVAATRGTFTLPPATAQVDEQPEVMGISQAGTIVIAEDTTTAPLPQSNDEAAIVVFLTDHQATRMESVPARECEGGCPNGGVCQLAVGRCACYSGVNFVDGDCPAGDEGVPAVTTTGQNPPASVTGTTRSVVASSTSPADWQPTGITTSTGTTGRTPEDDDPSLLVAASHKAPAATSMWLMPLTMVVALRLQMI